MNKLFHSYPTIITDTFSTGPRHPPPTHRGQHTKTRTSDMADNQPQPIAAPFPAPPPFYHHFTKSNLSHLRRLQKDASQQTPQPNGDSTGTDNNSSDTSTTNHDSKPDLDILSLPPELRYLLPPPRPTTTYTTFARPINLTAPDLSLADAGVEQLYPSPPPDTQLNPQPPLLSLARSLLTTYLSLIGNLAVNPEGFEDKVEDLQTLAFNMEDLINRYRPHQARESLVLMLEGRVEGLRNEIQRIRDGGGKVEELMKSLGESGAGEQGEEDDRGQKGAGGEDSERQRQRGLWRGMAECMAEG
ncbi:Mediator of RNA polymerase II transcription subunit 7 [Saxophila tyrrhenica]|uniref:Mediator of RNA polymerase II transcription subunit 7 n=1 Tax=Saxophila tyrrhenica TaxID=1690608 RepID=A0AAV9NTI1_9PEZI|nr:Mediator of RNA polymerase II transcription subunit 7 [Saxophila tyrrhenica]